MEMNPGFNWERVVRPDRSGGEKNLEWWRGKLNAELERVDKSLRPEDDAAQLAIEWAARISNLELAGMRDWMTGVFSPLEIKGSIEELARLSAFHGQGMLVAMMDLDNFSDVALGPDKKRTPERDTLADGAVVRFAQMVNEMGKERASLGEEWKGMVLGRLGGEEFVVGMPGINNPEMATQALEVIRQRIEERLAREAGLTGLKGVQTVSIGGVLIRGAMGNYETVLGEADRELMRAKEGGRNQVKVGTLIQMTEDEQEMVSNRAETRQVRSLEERQKRQGELVPELQTDILASRNEVSRRRELVEGMATTLDRLEQDLLLDEKTGVLHKGAGRERARRLLEIEPVSGHELGMIVVDLDGFKQVNDLQPEHHAAGDRVLITAAKILKECAGEGEVVRSRPGGEFILLVPHIVTKDELMTTSVKVWDEIRKRLAGEAKIDTKIQEKLTVSVGAVMARAGEELAQVEQRLATMLHLAKENPELGGRDCVACEEAEGAVIYGSDYYRRKSRGEQGEDIKRVEIGKS